MGDYINVPIRDFGNRQIQYMINMFSQSVYVHICGGIARFCASPLDSPELPRDIDLYCINDWWYERVPKWLVSEGLYEESIELGEHIRQLNPTSSSGYTFPVQVMSPKFGKSVEEILDGFDFSICRAAIVSDKEALVDVDFMEHESKKLLHLRRPASNRELVARTLKYLNKGYKVPTALHLVQILGLVKEFKEEELRYVMRYASGQGLIDSMFGDTLLKMYEQLLEKEGDI